MSTVIYTIFAGRQSNLEIQFKYLDKLIERKELNQVHLWDYTRDITDSVWLNTIFGRGAIYRNAKYDYKKVPLDKIDGQFDISFDITNVVSDAHILLVSKSDKPEIFEIVLGGWNNTRSAIRILNAHDLMTKQHATPLFVPNKANNISITHSNNVLRVYHNSILILSSIICTQTHFDVYLSGYHNTLVEYDLSKLPLKLPTRTYTPRDTEKYKLYSPDRKYTWIDYYMHYTPTAYPDHIIVKGDDDIVFIDIDGFPKWMANRRKDQEPLLSFPSIINNGVCAYYQQQNGLVPYSVGTFPYDTFKGALWSSADLCKALHEHFLQNRDAFIAKSHTLETIKHKIGDRISINMFAICSRDLGVFQECVEISPSINSIDDEYNLSVLLPLRKNRYVVIDPSSVVSHFSFCQQVESHAHAALLGQVLELYADAKP
jgi:hypothetical protein